MIVEILGEEFEVDVLHFSPAEPSYTDGWPDSWFEGCPAEIEYEVYDENGLVNLEERFSWNTVMEFKEKLIRKYEKEMLSDW